VDKIVGGIILAGGQSRRMGTNKALLRLEPGGPTIIEKVLTALREVSPEIWLVTNQPTTYAGLGLPMVGDNYQVGASLAGLEAGLTVSPHQFNLVVACDMPYLNPILLRTLVDWPRDYAALVPLNNEGQPETLCAIYSKDCLPAIRMQLAQGQYRLAGWLSQVKTVFVPAAKLEIADPGLGSFTNLNTPSEFERYRNG